MEKLVCLLLLVYFQTGIQAVCPSDSVTVFATQGPQFISSPNYPGEYGVFGHRRLSCSWIIRASPEFDDVVIMIQVLNSSLEPSTGCLRDSVNVVDGSRFFHSPLTTWCGSKFPSSPIVTSGPAAFIKFSTDFDNNDYTGFLLAFWVAKTPLIIVNVQPWTTINYVLLSLSIIIFSSIIGYMVILGLVRSWRHYQQMTHYITVKKYK